VIGRLALCLNPDDPTLANIIAGARRSMDPRSAKGARDIVHRINRREAILDSVIDIQSPQDPGVLPYFTPNFNAGSRTGIRIAPEALDGLVKLWVRGLHMYEVGSIIPASYEVSVEH
jgi:hypothetical protein